MPDSCLKLIVSYVYINEKSVLYIHFGFADKEKKKKINSKQKKQQKLHETHIHL